MYSISEHFRRRIDGFLSVDVDPTTQIGFVSNAIREGGWFGVGVGKGEVKWSLPDAHTDFIIAGDSMGPAKKEKAEKLGVNMISENDFKQMIAE